MDSVDRDDELAATAERIEALVRRLHPRFPDIDITDLVHIIEARLRPFGSGRRFFLRAMGKVHVP